MPRSFATRSTLRPLVIVRRTASRLNSSVKRRCLFPLTATFSILHRGWLSAFAGQVQSDLCVAKSTLSRWRSEHEQADFLESPHGDVTKELARLRKGNEILRQEREILKKAAAFFAMEGSR